MFLISQLLVYSDICKVCVLYCWNSKSKIITLLSLTKLYNIIKLQSINLNLALNNHLHVSVSDPQTAEHYQAKQR